MSFCIICFLCGLHHRSRRVNPAQQYSFSPDLTAELEDWRKFSLNALTVLLAFLALSGSKGLRPVVLTLLIYTISLRFAVNGCFLRRYPTLARPLHALPLLGTSCMAAVVLISDLQSPGLAVASILLGTLPLVTLVAHHGCQCDEASEPGLPIQMQDVPTPAGQVSQAPPSDGS